MPGARWGYSSYPSNMRLFNNSNYIPGTEKGTAEKINERNQPFFPWVLSNGWIISGYLHETVFLL